MSKSKLNPFAALGPHVTDYLWLKWATTLALVSTVHGCSTLKQNAYSTEIHCVFKVFYIQRSTEVPIIQSCLFFLLGMVTYRIDRCYETYFINEIFFVFQIHDGPNSTSPAFLEQPRYDGGSWTRPVIAATSKYVFLKFIPGPTKGKTFVGFKASYWTVQSKYI